MIFVAVGTQLTFPRLINTVDKWAAGSNEKIVAQIGPSELKPQNMESHQFLSPDEFFEFMADARVIISHAGMGTILSAMQLHKPIIIMPRQAVLKEQRNDHQLATAKKMMRIKGIHIALDEKKLLNILQNMQSLAACDSMSPDASVELINTIKNFIGGC